VGPRPPFLSPPPGVGAVIPEGSEVPEHDRPSALVRFEGTLGVNPDVWREEALWAERRRGPFPSIPIDKRNTPYSRLYDTSVPEVKIPARFFPQSLFPQE